MNRTDAHQGHGRPALLRECCELAESRVDREAGVIYDVKILGRQSPNKHGQPGATSTEYTLEALREAAPLYEGVKVNVDHIRKKGEDRPAAGRIGKLVGVYVNDQGLFAKEFHVNRGHPLAESLFEAAERKELNDTFGLSHNADGIGDTRNGVFVVSRIPKVRSVDLVADPGSVQGLFESQEQERTETMPATQSRTIRKLLEGLYKGDKSDPLKPFVKLLEMEEFGELPIDASGEELAAPDAGGPAEMGWREQLAQSVVAIINDESLDEAATKKKVMQVLKLLDEEAAAPVEEVDKDTDDNLDEDMDSFEKAVKTKESDKEMKESLESVQRELAIVHEMNAAGVVLASDTPQYRALVALKESKDRQALLKDYAQHNRRRGPRSQGPLSLLESRNDGPAKPVKTYDDFLAAIR